MPSNGDGFWWRMWVARSVGTQKTVPSPERPTAVRAMVCCCALSPPHCHPSAIRCCWLCAKWKKMEREFAQLSRRSNTMWKLIELAHPGFALSLTHPGFALIELAHPGFALSDWRFSDWHIPDCHIPPAIVANLFRPLGSVRIRLPSALLRALFPPPSPDSLPHSAVPFADPFGQMSPQLCQRGAQHRSRSTIDGKQRLGESQRGYW